MVGALLLGASDLFGDSRAGGQASRCLRGVGLASRSRRSRHPHAGGHAPAALLALCAGHAALHLFYILTWHSRHTDRVIRLSSVDTRRRLGGAYSAGEVAWYWIGTAFDMLTHAAVLRQLLAAPEVQ